MKYLFVLENFAPDFEYGGVVRSVYDLADSLSPRHEILIYSYSSQLHSLDVVKKFDKTLNNNIKIIRIRGGNWSYYWNLVSLLNREKFDYAYLPVVWSFSSFLCPIFFKLKSLKFLFSPHGSLDKHLFNWKRPIKFLYWKCFGRLAESLSSYIIVNSKFEADEAALIGRSNKKLRIIPNIISLDAEMAVKKYSTNEIRLLFFGRVSPKKQLELIIMAMEDFKKRNISLKLDIFGQCEPKYTDRLTDLINKLNLDSQVCFKGHVTRAGFVTDHLTVRYINILPSLDENFAISVGELALLGIPSVVSPFVGIGGFYDHSSIVISNNEVQEVCRGIEVLIPRATWESYAQNARLTTIAAFSKEKVASLFHSLTAD